ncbi:uncharacterized protein LOC123037372 [Drosophila rhopaloa]|uniref:Uncharacterized protein n=1 Tax=Drosophila rhopaloa TaxID=1041015 RepID=A0ABM5J3T2_DRORH|nr:uncharacterized protein LOC123037372 [Drosophila rhopaloa]
MEHLRPLSYEEMCQMEMLQAAGGPSASSGPQAMMPIMVIPTALLPAPAEGAVGGGVPGAAMVEHFYQLQPTHHLLPADPATTTTLASPGELALLQGEQIPHSIQHPQQMNILCTGTLGRQRMPASAGGPNQIQISIPIPRWRPLCRVVSSLPPLLRTSSRTLRAVSAERAG